MRAGDCRDDGHPQPVAALVAGPLAIGLLERFEQSADLARPDHRAAVGDGQAGTAAVLTAVVTWTWPSGTLCRTALSTRLATRLSARAGSPVTVAGPRLAATRTPRLVSIWLVAGHDPGGDLGEVERFPVPQAALAGGQREQRVDEAFLLFAEPEHLLAGGPQRFRARGGIGECHL